ncbi:putative F-box protein At3g44060 isoform X1 [Papaver somniferum]|uniref:putative F-box protein At3g44060 isoform X1 n=1 Tax=Papaver somniferum TaxID=3469 RepID=UPI000E6FC21A|nr:putative F-box protein At3g44060 isoform X1 [Papaver somniferum]XP_026430671.1 putative F-box protein At3g44060 isoform X1 [Papaver somniferum]XP_026430672.1 putative F-box protein At3g44060 isoform X1 [Papaver somniferum]XP_026430673.1 putative F-box protein At3g44060 isoform X1 [Papaver somniferum]XP_026430674.1 putative F-box protein At3g44060 isoform X1 [Papaver somniferum]
MMHVNRWIYNAVKYNVQEITMVIEQLQNSAYEIPQRLLNCKSLKKLVIRMFDAARYVDIILPRSMYLPRLKVLLLDGLSFSNLELAKKLLSSCPVLKDLEIINCDIQSDNQKILIVDSVSVKKFTYTCWLNYTMPSVIKLCAPNLEEFNCRSFFTQDYSLENCSPLSVVDLCMILEEHEEDENAETYSNLPSEEKEVYAIRMMKSLGAVYMVKRLRLSPGFLEVLSRAPDLLDYQPPRLCNLKCLTLVMWSTRGCLRAIVYLLSISPNIDTIYLELEKVTFNQALRSINWSATATFKFVQQFWNIRGFLISVVLIVLIFDIF